MTNGELDLLWLLKAWLAHRRSGWTHRLAEFYGLCWFVASSHRVFLGVSPSRAHEAKRELQRLLRRDLAEIYCPFKSWDGHANPARVAWVRKIIKELECKQ